MHETQGFIHQVCGSVDCLADTEDVVRNRLAASQRAAILDIIKPKWWLAS
jgi:hypothetical protein